MKYFINKKEFDTDSIQVEKLGIGNEGVVYKVGNEAAKIYNGVCLKTRLGPVGVDILSEIPTNRILVPQKKINDKDGNFCGYTTKYIPEINYDYETHTMKEFLNELLLYEQDIALLSQNGIWVCDMTYDNIVYSKNNSIYMVDPGSFDFTDSNVLYMNNEELTRLFIQLLSYGLQTEYQYKILCNILDDGNRLYDNIVNRLDNENETITNYSEKIIKKRLII